MIRRLAWAELPADLRAAVEDQIGAVERASSPDAGRNSDLATSLQTAGGDTVFCKGIKVDSPKAFMHRNEAAVNPFLPESLAPRLLWTIEQRGWLLLGFEHVAGQHADFSPGTASHLPLLAAAVRRISSTPGPPPDVGQRPIDAHWTAAVNASDTTTSPLVGAHPWSIANADILATLAGRAPGHMHGSTLIHFDLNPLNVLVDDSAAHVVDWAWWRTGAAWIDPAFLVVRLIAAGNTPDQAETWARQFVGYREAEPDAITAFAASLVLMWEQRFAGTTATLAAVQWAQHRLSIKDR